MQDYIRRGLEGRKESDSLPKLLGRQYTAYRTVIIRIRLNNKSIFLRVYGKGKGKNYAMGRGCFG